MAVKKRKASGVWYVDIQYTDPTTGRRQRLRRSTGQGVTKKEARELEHRWKCELEAPPIQRARRKSAVFSGFAKYWLDIHVKTNCKPSTLRSYEQIVRKNLVPYFRDQDMRDISREQIEAYKAKKAKRLSPKTVNNHLGVLSRLLRSALDWQYIEHNPCQGIGLLRLPPAEMTFWDQQQSEAFLAKALQSEPQWHPFFMTALRTGLRLGELFALRWESIDFVKRRIHVRQSHHRGHLGSPKNGRTRNVPISPALAAVLRDYRHLKGELVFCTAEGNYLTRDRVKRPFERITKAAGLPRIRLHDLRHSFASQLTMAGVPQRAVQLYLGHSDPKMTMRYSHLSPEADDDYVSRLDEKVWAHFGHTSPNFAIATSEN